ncbi:MAG: putative nucleic acid binding and endonuclease domain, partial [Actinomycetota bacterium]
MTTKRGRPLSQPKWTPGAGIGETPAPTAGMASPARDALAAIDTATGMLAGLLADGQVDSGALAGLAEALHTAVTRLQGTHLAAVAAVRAAAAAADPAALPPGPATAAAWLTSSHRLAPGAASGLGRDADWLAEHPASAAALAAGDIAVAHVTVMRQISGRTPARRGAFAGAEDLFVELARRADAAVLRRAMNAWAANIDPVPTDDDAEDAHSRRRVFLTPVADGWDLSGYLPAALGAELSAILNAFMDPNRTHADGAGAPDVQGTSREPARARRADALLDLARTAAAAVLPTAARTRAAVVVTLPGHRLAPRDHTPGCPAGCSACAAAAAAGDALSAVATGPGKPRPERLGTTWAVGNGPGVGTLAACEAAWLTCDAQITRLVLDPESRPLNLGRATRTIPTHLRRALDARDGGCIIPGCDRPPGWCEAHHVTHWADGGNTDIANLALTCAKHH